MTSPPYIIFEGMDGCGKTTLSTAVYHALRNEGLPVAQLWMPGMASMVGRLIHEVLDGRAHVDPQAMFWLFMAEVADLEPQIREMRKDGVIVVCDRHSMFSTFVYQAPFHGDEYVEAAFNHIGLSRPTHAYILDVPVETIVERVRQRGKKLEFYESEDLDELQRLREAYQDFLDWGSNCRPLFWPPRLEILDGTLPIEDNVARVLADVTGEL